MVDSTPIRARWVAAGAKKNSPVGRTLCRNRGGFMTKPHLSCNAYNQICALDLTGSQTDGYL